MLHSQQGSVSRIVLGCFIGLSFCFALAWPQYTKHRSYRHLNEAAQLGRAIAFAQGNYKQLHGSYTPDFRQLDVSLSCPIIHSESGPLMDCPDYTYQLQEGPILQVSNKSFPAWLEIDITQGAVQCRYEQEDWVGQDLCKHLQ